MDPKERILTFHPEGKKGVNILLFKYLQIKEAILDTFKTHDVISYEDLNEEVIKRLDGKFEGKIVWYVVSVKQDLEARKIIERIPKKSPQQLRLVKK